MLLDLGLQTEGKFQKALEASQYPEKSKASQQERGPVEKWKGTSSRLQRATSQNPTQLSSPPMDQSFQIGREMRSRALVDSGH